MKPNDVTKNQEKDRLAVLWWMFVVIGLIWIGSYIIISMNFTKEDRGPLGDTFGAINSLFSGLAFCGIIYTIMLQRKELRLQREELANTRSELKRSADAQEETKKQMERQANNLKISAMLSALSTLAQFYKKQAIEELNSGVGYGNYEEYLRKSEHFYHRIEDILDDK